MNAAFRNMVQAAIVRRAKQTGQYDNAASRTCLRLMDDISRKAYMLLLLSG